MRTYKNSNGFNPILCECGTALNHWKNNTGNKTPNCSIKGCTEKSNVGGHVINCHGNAFKSIFIIPLCNKHNNTNFTDCFEIQASIKPAIAKKTIYCKRN